MTELDSLSFFSRWTLKGRLRRALNDLRTTPLRYGGPAPDGGRAWGMFLDSESKSSQFGVYSTSFAIQLLAKSKDPKNPQVKNAIVEGVNFLLSQYLQHQQLSEHVRVEGKQANKLKEVGHTDFDIALKHALLLEALAAVCELRNIDSTYNQCLAKVQPHVNAILKEFVTFSVEFSDEETGAALRAWRWHKVGKLSSPDPIPTSFAIRVLLSPLFSGTAYPVEPKSVQRYLAKTLHSGRIRPVIKAFSVSLLRAEAGSWMSIPDVEQLLNDFKSELRDDVLTGWQETYHYELITSSGLSHYKPWIWLCPKIELAHAAMLLSNGVFSQDLLRVLYAVIRNIERNRTFRSSAVKPPTLQGAWRSALFLEDVENSYSKLPWMTRLKANLFFLINGLERVWYRYIAHPLNLLAMAGCYVLTLIVQRFDPELYTAVLSYVLYGGVLLFAIILLVCSEQTGRIRRAIFLFITNLIASYIGGLLAK